MVEPGGPGGPLAPPQYFADQLTLIQPGRADYPHVSLLAPQMFFTFLHWGNIINLSCINEYKNLKAILKHTFIDYCLGYKQEKNVGYQF